MPIRMAKRGSQRLPRYRRGFMVDETKGILRVRKWPRKARGPVSHRVQQWRKYFRSVQLVHKYLPDPERAAYTQMASVGPWLPRDFWTAHQYGRTPIIPKPDGNSYPRSAMVEVSQALDAVSQSPGSLLLRHPGGWGPLLAGPTNFVLTSTGPNTIPVWAAAGGGGGGGLTPPNTETFPDASEAGIASLVQASQGGIIGTLRSTNPGGDASYYWRNAPSGGALMMIGFESAAMVSAFKSVGLAAKATDSNRRAIIRVTENTSPVLTAIQAVFRDGAQGGTTARRNATWSASGPIFFALQYNAGQLTAYAGPDPAAMDIFWIYSAADFPSPIAEIGIFLGNSTLADTNPVSGRFVHYSEQ